MWLASLSISDKHGRLLPNSRWTTRQMRLAQRVLGDWVLKGVGDAERERCFSMCITLCLHRGVRPDELALIGRDWHEAEPVDLAGGPLEILYARGVPDVESAKPCHRPGKRLIDLRRIDLWFPVDCGECPPCVARQNARVCSLAS